MIFLGMSGWLMLILLVCVKKIEPNPSAPSYIKTVVGVGYRFEDG